MMQFDNVQTFVHYGDFDEAQDIFKPWLNTNFDIQFSQ